MIDENGKLFSGSVMIFREPVIKEKIQQLILVPIDEKNKNFLLNTSIYEKYNYGDMLKINCQLEIPKNFDENFDYKMS